ncbi:SphA family protein [Bradyrhizobium manausense]|uniref:Phenol degradation protein meta n=1 Tax=Bradyrhizobium manausense TaxID=989370 RepID=A0A0R3CZK6_9BRAD|nr:transporter [Bradyrhizobium manausense]KRQ03035.1 phenol degradation protein meta [Bradyrhizobium manausense]
MTGHIRKVGLTIAVALTGFAVSPALADSGGVSFWLPGIFGSLAAVPAAPGWAYSTIYIHLNDKAGGGQNFVTSGGIPGSVTAGLNAHADVLVQGITYTSPMPVLGGQAAFTLLTAPGNIGVGIDATLTGPRGNTISGGASDNRTTLTDVFYQGTLKWNQGVHNELVYLTGNIPSGTYDSSRLANLSFGFPAIDAGAGYTYLDPKSGHEFSIVGGLTYNFTNSALRYQNGIDFHLDWAASQFVSKTVHVGIAGYYFQQITDDSGPGARLGGFRGMSVGIGPQIGFMIPMSEGYQGYLNIRGYKDLEVENRPSSWSTWVTFSLSQAASPPAATKPIVRKY